MFFFKMKLPSEGTKMYGHDISVGITPTECREQKKLPKSPFLADVCNETKAKLSFVVASTFSLELRTTLYISCTPGESNGEGRGLCPHWNLEGQKLQDG